MKVYELLEVLQGGIPTVRIIDANVPQDNNRDMKGVLLCDFLDNLSHKMLSWQQGRGVSFPKWLWTMVLRAQTKLVMPEVSMAERTLSQSALFR